MAEHWFILYFLVLFNKYVEGQDNYKPEAVAVSQPMMLWPDATIPFYINPAHFDLSQQMVILKTLSLFSSKTCLQFVVVPSIPGPEDHVMSFVNPQGTKKCDVLNVGHSYEGVHAVHVGYDCLRSPDIEMLVMRALGFPFEHNRLLRDVYLEVQPENVEASARDLFVKDDKLPPVLKVMPYDINSVMHFGERAFSKNGHKTLVFKPHVTQQRDTLTATDIRKIDAVYSPACLTRDRKQKIELCQSFPGVARRKRAITDLPDTVNLRVNRNITPPPEELHLQNMTENLTASLNKLGITSDVQTIVDQVYKVAATALKNARIKYCNDTDLGEDLRADLRSNTNQTTNSPDLMGIVETVANYAQALVDHALTNLTTFCDTSDSLSRYARQRWRCENAADPRCAWNKQYKSTKVGAPMYSTQHRPFMYLSTQHRWPTRGHHLRDGKPDVNDTEIMPTTPKTRRSRRSAKKPKKAPRALDGKANKTRRASSSEDSSSSVSENEDDLKKIGHAKITTTTTTTTTTQKSIGRSNKNKKKKIARQQPKVVKSLEVKDSDSSDDKSQKQDEKQSSEKVIRQLKPDESVKWKAYRSGTPVTVKLSKLNQEFFDQRKWPTRLIPYTISNEPGFDLGNLRSRLAEINRILKKNTCVKMREIQDWEGTGYKDYIVLDTSPDYVTGRVGGRQIFGSRELFEGGQHKQHTAMMVMAMLGFYFELSRHDRDKFIRVHLRHVRPDKLHHFEKIREEGTLPLPYDYRSATQPAWQYWRKIGHTGISTVATYKDRDPTGQIMKQLGQHDKLLSDIDIVKINSVYGTDCLQNKDLRNRKNRKGEASDDD